MTAKMRHLEVNLQKLHVCIDCKNKEAIEAKIVSPSRIKEDLKVLILDCRI